MDYIIPVAVTVAVLVACYFIVRESDKTITVVDTLRDGKDDHINPETLPPSSNQPKGIELSYTAWIRIDDFTYRYGSQKIIFVKGTPDLSIACPALLIDANTNVLLVKVDTFGVQETIPIVSVPAKKWIHFAINVNQTSIDVYINGIAYAHHVLTNLPKQNTASLITSPDGGFAGKIARLEYHAKVLSETEILSKAAERPPVGDEPDQIFPPYFSSSWFSQTTA